LLSTDENVPSNPRKDTDVIKPLVTIGVCVRNCETLIKEVIRSIMAQDFPHESIEVSFVDDGSADKTLSVILSSIPMMDTKVKVHHQKWKGLGAARNLVVNNASGDYIIWVDGDMTLPTDHVRKQVEFMELNSKVGIAKAKHGKFRRENLVAALESIPYLVEDFRSKGKVTSKLPGTGGSIYRVEAIRQIGGFDDNIKGTGEDQDAAWRIRAAGWSIARTPAVFYERRRATWKALWDEYFWWGYGMHHTLHKHPDLIFLYKMLPPSGFLVGLRYSFDAYRLMHQKKFFLLPLHFVFKMTAWCLGFAKSHIDSLRAEYRMENERTVVNT